jgi:ATP-dependent Clp protease ATP-binding subunit ClpA
MNSPPRRHRPFTSSAKQIIDQFAQRAYCRGIFDFEDTIVPLALWTLIRWERKVGLAALETMGVDLHRVADKLDELLTRVADERPVVARNGFVVFADNGERVNLDPAAAMQSLLDRAQLEARKLNHEYVGSEHLLLAIITLADSRLSQILGEELVTYDCTRETILELLGSPGAAKDT